MMGEEGYSRALTYMDAIKKNGAKVQPQMLKYDSFLGGQVELEEASEPTDIIWENRAFSPTQRNIRRVIVYLIIIFMLCCSGFIIFKCSVKSQMLKARYPLNINQCDEIKEKQFENDSEKFWRAGKEEFEANYPKQIEDKKTNYLGPFQCMCEKDDKHQKMKFDLRIDIKGLKSNKDVPICKYYFDDKKKSVIIGGSISLIIIVVNGILKTSIIALIQWVGEDTYSEQLSSITNGVFYAQFFNTGLLLLLVNANMTEHKPEIITK